MDYAAPAPAQPFQVFLDLCATDKHNLCHVFTYFSINFSPLVALMGVLCLGLRYGPTENASVVSSRSS